MSIRIFQNPVAENLKQIMQTKNSNLGLALDLPDKKKFLTVLEKLGDYICLVKTHIDIIENFDWQFIKEFLKLKEKYNFLIFEDRKFVDIGKIVKCQYSRGLYKIIEWADIINCHIISGPGVIEGLREAVSEQRRNRALLIVMQMTSDGQLINQAYTEQALAWAKEYSDFVIGFIASAQDKQAFSILRRKAGLEFMLFTPGIHFNESRDSLRQTYLPPATAVSLGADVILVGQGIYEVEDNLMVEKAKKYQKAGQLTG